MNKEKDFLTIGEIVSTVGLRGEMKVKPLTDVLEDFENFEECYLELKGERIPLTVATVRYTKNMAILSFEGYESVEAVTPWKGAQLSIPRPEEHLLGENRYYIVDLKGCKVFLEDGSAVGIVTHVYQGAHDLLEIEQPDGNEVLIPMVDQFIKKVDIPNKTILLSPIEGLLS